MKSFMATITRGNAMSNETIPALALAYLTVGSIYAAWHGIANVLDAIDASTPVAIAALVWLLCLSIVTFWCRHYDRKF
jgi:hypothetical protein